MATVVRRVHDPVTRACTERKKAGKNPREIRRILKRYLTRHLYRALHTPEDTILRVA